jgi:hypothetical protein
MFQTETVFRGTILSKQTIIRKTYKKMFLIGTVSRGTI